MQIITEPQKMQSCANSAREEKRRIGFIPTMGYLHEGHLSLIRRARTENQLVVASIFVNPTQFAPSEDLAKYPQSLERDQKMVEAAGADILFCPAAHNMYPASYATYVTVEKLSAKLCGVSRPTHFRGVTTIVAKLFNLVKPDNAYFGQKDAQQFVIIKKMTADLNFEVKLHLLPTVRDNDGLALSSRNKYLSAAERPAALILSQALKRAEALVNSGVKDVKQILAQVSQIIASEKLVRLDYAAAVELENLTEVASIGEEPVLLALAVYLGNTRLIDNVIFNREKYAN